MPFFDELWTGVPVIEAPALERTHALAHGGTAVMLLVAPALLAAVLEVRLLMWAERGDPRRWIAGSQLVIAACTAIAALAPAAGSLTLMLGLAGTASGVSTSLAQGLVVAADPEQGERSMMRWTLASALGDVAAPLLLAATAAVGLGWQAALLTVAALVGVHALAVRLGPRASASAAGDEVGDALAFGLRDALRHRRLMAWLAAATACTLLDEVLVAFAALHLRLDRNASPSTIAIAVAAWAAGSALALAITERLVLRVSPRRVLGVAALACTIAAALWWALPSTAAVVGALVVVGVTTAPLFPIAQAQAHAQVPGRGALIGAASQPFVLFELVTPWLLGLAADRWGLGLALALMAVGPAALVGFALAPRAWVRPPS